MQMKPIPKQLFVDELRKRIQQLAPITDLSLFMPEAARQVIWIKNQKLFNPALSRLEFVLYEEETQINDLLRRISVSSKKIWNDISPKITDEIRVYLNNQYNLTHKELTDHDYIGELFNRFKTIETQSSLNLFHELYFVIRELAVTDRFFPLVANAYDPGSNRLTKGIHELFKKHQTLETQFRANFETSIWGAWALLKQIQFFSEQDDSLRQLTDWGKTFGIQKHLVFFARVGDFIQEYEEKKFKQFSFEKIRENSIWSKHFLVTDNMLHLGEYGNLMFFPANASNRIKEVPDSTAGGRMVAYILAGGKKGVPRSEISSNVDGINKQDISGQVDSFNSRAEAALASDDLKARVKIWRIGPVRNQTLYLTVTPAQGRLSDYIRENNR